MRRLGLLIGPLLLALGCTTARFDAATHEAAFRLPFVQDYAVANTVVFPWCDACLTNSPAVYSQALAGPLSALAASAYGYRLKMDVDSLAELDFAPARLRRRYGRRLNYFDPVYGKNQVGFTFATRKAVLDGKVWDLLVVLVRGTFGRYEWVSNLNVCNAWGRVADPLRALAPRPFLHEGFDLAASCVLEELARYVADEGIDLKRTKVLVTGHSRGAAVANILGARLDDAAAGLAASAFSVLGRDNIFVYTFATPNTIIAAGIDAHARRYDNIFNVVNPEDMVPLVPLARWQSDRYGRDLVLKSYDHLPPTGSWSNGPYVRMKDAFREMTGYEYWHTPLGTNSTSILTSLVGYLAPNVDDLYSIPPEQRADGNLTSVHAICETVVWRMMDDPDAAESRISLGRDVHHLSQAYAAVSDRGEDGAEKARDNPHFMPDGHDFSQQPGMFDIGWRLVCMHAPATYIGWMKAGEEYGPEKIYVNWKE